MSSVAEQVDLRGGDGGSPRGAATAACQPLLLPAAGRLARVLRHRAVSRLPRGAPGGRPGSHTRAGRAGHAAPSVPDHGRGRVDDGRILVPVVADRALRVELAQPGAAARAGRLCGAARRHAAGACAGVPGRQRVAGSRRRRRGRDREPARPAQHARRADADPHRAGALLAAQARRGGLAQALHPGGVALGGSRHGRVLRGGHRVRRGGGASGGCRRVVWPGRGRTRAVVGARAGARRGRGWDRLRGLCAGGLGAQRRLPGGRAHPPAQRPRCVHGQDPAARAQAQARRAGRIRAADGAARLPRRWLALRGLPGGGAPAAHRRARARLGRNPAWLLAVRPGAAARHRLASGVHLVAVQRAPVRGDAVPRAPSPARARGGPPAAPPFLARQRSHAGGYRGGDDRPRARLAAVRVRGERRGHQEAALLIRDPLQEGHHRPVPHHPAGPGEAVRLERPAEPVSVGRAARALTGFPRPADSLGRGRPAGRLPDLQRRPRRQRPAGRGSAVAHLALTHA